MKHISLAPAVLSSILGFYSASSQNHMMKLEDSLKVNSEFMEAKRKSIGGAGKYEFGPYKIISSKKGATITKEKSKFFSKISEEESKQVSSFVFTGHETDTVEANLVSQ